MCVIHVGTSTAERRTLAQGRPEAVKEYKFLHSWFGKGLIHKLYLAESRKAEVLYRFLEEALFKPSREICQSLPSGIIFERTNWCSNSNRDRYPHVG